MKLMRPNLDFLSQRDIHGRNVFSYLILKNQYMVMVFLISEILASRRERNVLSSEPMPYEPMEGGREFMYVKSPDSDLIV